MSVCNRCAAADHSAHRPSLGGICIGCACPISPDAIRPPEFAYWCECGELITGPHECLSLDLIEGGGA